MQLHPSNQKAFPPKKVKEILEKTSCIGVGDWDKGERIIDDFEKTLKKGDIVAVKSGKTPIALVEIISDCERTENVNNDLDWFKYRRKIKVLDFYKPEYKFNIPDSRGTLTICRNSNAETTKIIKKWYEKIKSKIYMKELLELLKANKNLILTGAPGTGKTYLAKEIAKEMIGAKTDEDLLNSDQFGFVQFHPSYDYTDFVEGLRPTKPDENGNIGFELKDGIFKEFCKKAYEPDYSKIVNNFNLAWDKLITSIIDGLAQNKTTKIGRWDYGLSSKGSLKYTSVKAPSQYTFTITKKNVFDAYQGKIARPAGGYQKDMEDIVKYMKDNYNLKDFPKSNKISNNGTGNFVFIIDEINRGEISKIFGELFFSIDPDYRGEKGSVKTLYSNLHEEINEMFYVPENVFIIGTMNDIDRSVESFDFAMRRRFVWREITAKESQQMFGNESWKEEAIKRMNKLNEAIGNIEGLNSSYHIGAAYFKNNLTKYNNDNDKWNKLWDLHLKPLLYEYLRGMSDQEKKLQNLEKAYNL
jgi:hypothetical protein